MSAESTMSVPKPNEPVELGEPMVSDNPTVTRPSWDWAERPRRYRARHRRTEEVALPLSIVDTGTERDAGPVDQPETAGGDRRRFG
jgi:hypothetical protein